MPLGVANLDYHSVRAEKRRVALNSVLAAVVITTAKFFAGWSTGSLGILSEALHSALDLVAAIITLFSVRVSDLPADAKHTYGHGKVENFSAFLETGLLLLTCVWIVWEAVHRLISRQAHIEATTAAFVVMAVSIVLDWWRSRALKRVAIKYNSQALEADALHFSTDIWSSGVVIAGLLLVRASDSYNIPWLALADPVAALIVAGVVVWVSWRLARQTIDALLDSAPAGIRTSIMDAVAAVPGVLEIDRVRIRRAGNRYFCEVAIALSRNVTFQRAGQVVSAVEAAVDHVLPEADVVVHTAPREQQTENIFDRIRAVASRNNLGVHDVSVQDLGGRLHVEQHLELNERLTLKEAHDMVTVIEAEMKSSVPEISTILTHIESEPATIEAAAEMITPDELEQRMRRVVAEFPEVIDLHDVVVKKAGDKLYVSCHCTMPDDMTLARVHELSTALEIRFKQEAPQLFKVLIHNEPRTDNRR